MASIDDIDYGWIILSPPAAGKSTFCKVTGLVDGDKIVSWNQNELGEWNSHDVATVVLEFMSMNPTSTILINLPSEVDYLYTLWGRICIVLPTDVEQLIIRNRNRNSDITEEGIRGSYEMYQTYKDKSLNILWFDEWNKVLESEIFLRPPKSLLV